MERKKFEELEISDDFMFGKVMRTKAIEKFFTICGNQKNRRQFYTGS